MSTITKMKLQNFKRFREFTSEFNESINLLIGDNESGKSSILTAIDLVISASTSKIQAMGLESLFNANVVEEYLAGERKYEDLPELYIELYLSEQNNPDLNGKNNSLDIKNCDGLRLQCTPRDDLSAEIADILSQSKPNFPFEFYAIKFTTFAGQAYTGYRKYLTHLLLDNSQISNEYATREYIKTVYRSTASETEINQHQNEYRSHKQTFRENVLGDINVGLDDYQFSIRTGSKANLETDLTILEDNIPLEDKGKGRQCFIKTEFALTRKEGKQKIDLLLLEEPENHLSHVNMRKLIQQIASSKNKQLFVSTHSNMVCSRLDLRKAIFLNSNNGPPSPLSALSDATANFFMKAPDNNVLELVLSKKVLLVEGDAEFVLMELFYKTVTGTELSASDVHVISVGGTSFKRYLELAEILNIRTAVITDNDGDVASCKARYADYIGVGSSVFCDDDETRSTFEIAMYEDNKAVCEESFSEGRKTLTVQQYMLKNKVDVAFELLNKKEAELSVPGYIKEAIEWLGM